MLSIHITRGSERMFVSGKRGTQTCCHGSLPVAQFRSSLLLFSCQLHTSLLQVGFFFTTKKDDIPKSPYSTFRNKWSKMKIAFSMILSGKMQRNILIGLARSSCPFVKQSFFHRDVELYRMNLNLFPILLQRKTGYGDWHPNRPTGGKYPKDRDKEGWRMQSMPLTMLYLELLKINAKIWN